jgi:hypothetical protein
MIKELIIDIAYDNIKLSQALTRAKIIANNLKTILLENGLLRNSKDILMTMHIYLTIERSGVLCS